MKMDMHCHTIFSYDAFVPLRGIIKTCQENAINCLAITDHNTVEGAYRLQKISPFKVVIGEEIKTSEGEIIGLFIKDKIPPYLSPEETMAEIKRQGGIVYLPHPFVWLRNRGFTKEKLDKLAKKIDIVEVLNSRSLHSHFNQAAQDFATLNGLLTGAGSDAHSIFEIGNAFVEIAEFDTAEDFLKNLKKAKIHGRQTPVFIRILMNRFARKGLRRLSRGINNGESICN